MAFVGDGNLSQFVGKDLTTTSQVNAYLGTYTVWDELRFRDPDDTIPAGVDLGVCNNYEEIGALGVVGDALLSFPAPASPLGANGKINGAFWIYPCQGTLQVTGTNTPVAAPSGLQQLAAAGANLATNIGNLDITTVLITIGVIALIIFLIVLIIKR